MTQQNRDDPQCHGNGAVHCCFVPGHVNTAAGQGEGVCEFLETDTIRGRHWVCGARRQLGNWDKVHRSKQYKDKVQSVWKANIPPVTDCGDWRIEGQCCFGDNPPIFNQG